MGGWRYWTDPDCVRHWAWFPRVGKPLAHYVGPCAKAALIVPPLLGVPAAAFYPPPPWIGGWPELYPSAYAVEYAFPFAAPYYPTEYAVGAEVWPIPPAGNSTLKPGEGPLSVPGALFAALPPPESVPSGETLPPGGLPTLQAFVPPDVQSVPEPSSAVVLAVGAGAAVLVKRRRA